MGKQKIFKWAPTPWDGQKGFWPALNRFFYQIEGPAQITAEADYQPYADTRNAPCPLCGRPMSLHVMDRGGPGEQTFVHCPE